MTTAKPRQDWVDIAKGIAIIAVVVGHIRFNWPNSKVLPLSDLLVWLWHVPVFFMIGGFFLKDEKMLHPGRFIVGKIKTLYLPLLYIYIPILILHNLFIEIGFYDTGIEYYGKIVTVWSLMDLLKHIGAAILCAGREPLLGAMWFGFVLFMALCVISVISWSLKRIGNKMSERNYELMRCLVILAIAIASCSLTKLFGITINRFNNTLVAVWLIYVGMMLVRKVQIRFDNSIIACICLIIAWHSATCRGGVSLVANDYSDVIVLTVSSAACLYIVCYISKIIERRNFMRNVLSRIGRDSLYIMGLHFIGFKFATLLINKFGYGANLAFLVPHSDGKILLFLLYIIFGVGAPLFIIFVFRLIKKGYVLLKGK